MTTVAACVAVRAIAFFQVVGPVRFERRPTNRKRRELMVGRRGETPPTLLPPASKSCHTLTLSLGGPGFVSDPTGFRDDDYQICWLKPRQFWRLIPRWAFKRWMARAPVSTEFRPPSLKNFDSSFTAGPNRNK